MVCVVCAHTRSLVCVVCRDTRRRGESKCGVCGSLTPEREGFAYNGARCVGARLPAAQTKDKEVVQLRSSLPLLVWRSCTWDLGMRGQGG